MEDEPEGEVEELKEDEEAAVEKCAQYQIVRYQMGHRTF